MSLVVREPFFHMAFRALISLLMSVLCFNHLPEPAISFHLQLQSALTCKDDIHLPGCSFGTMRGFGKKKESDEKQRGHANVLVHVYFYSSGVLLICVTLTSCMAADGICVPLPELPLLAVSNKRTRVT